MTYKIGSKVWYISTLIERETSREICHNCKGNHTRQENNGTWKCNTCINGTYLKDTGYDVLIDLNDKQNPFTVGEGSVDGKPEINMWAKDNSLGLILERRNAGEWTVDRDYQETLRKDRCEVNLFDTKISYKPYYTTRAAALKECKRLTKLLGTYKGVKVKIETKKRSRIYRES